MNAQYLCNRQIEFQYAFREGCNNERHGSQAERLLAQSDPNKQKAYTRIAVAMPVEINGMLECATIASYRSARHYAIERGYHGHGITSVCTNFCSRRIRRLHSGLHFIPPPSSAYYHLQCSKAQFTPVSLELMRHHGEHSYSLF